PLPATKSNTNGCRMKHYVNYGEGKDFENVGTIYWRCTTQGHNHYHASQVTNRLDESSLQPFYDLRALHDLSGRKYSSKGMATELQRTHVISSLIEKATQTVQAARAQYSAPAQQTTLTYSGAQPIVPLPRPKTPQHLMLATPKRSRPRTTLLSPPASSPLRIATPVDLGKRKAAELAVTPPPKKLKLFPCPSPILGDRRKPIDVDGFEGEVDSNEIEFV
ncbi:hypothetical protein MPER_04479, partial [Moniliophthora perniciosa FA553]